jgi:hypothetical protein
MPGKLRPLERMRLAKSLRQQANNLPNLTVAQRQEKRRLAGAMVALNNSEASGFFENRKTTPKRG